MEGRCVATNNKGESVWLLLSIEKFAVLEQSEQEQAFFVLQLPLLVKQVFSPANLQNWIGV